MAAINDLVNQISDARLRERLSEEVAYLTKKKKFGLVFEEHMPEKTLLYNSELQVGMTVCYKNKSVEDTYLVTDIEGDKVSLREFKTGKLLIEEKRKLVQIRRFGEAVFPKLKHVDSVQKGSKEDTWHMLIEADNYHALQLLDYLYPGKVDCIYIDPPYNTGAKDWKYNNSFVDSNDEWRHSKWLAFMKRRLAIAKKLLNPDDSILIIAIDDNELFALGMLLEELFKGSNRQVIDITINPKGKSRDKLLSQVDEYLVVVYIGDASTEEIIDGSEVKEVRWPYLRRSDIQSARGTTKGGKSQFYPIYVNNKTGRIEKIGQPIPPDVDRMTVKQIEGCTAVFPVTEKNVEMNWGLVGSSLQSALDEDFVQVKKNSNNKFQPYSIQYFTAPAIEKVRSGEYTVIGKRDDGSKIVVSTSGSSKKKTTVWKKNLYDANKYGTQIVSSIIKNKQFPFPKSLYAVHDTLKAFLNSKKDALVVDFFAGSGTTLHALNLLNSEDNGNRRCILVTNNEVSANEAKELSENGYLPGDKLWEENGICRSVTWPRVKHSILGIDTNGDPIDGVYFIDNFKLESKKRTVRQIDYIDSSKLQTLAQKKKMIGLLGKNRLASSKIDSSGSFAIDDEYPTAILFDVSSEQSWYDELEGKDNVVELLFVTDDKKEFKRISEKSLEILGTKDTYIQDTSNMCEGFHANCEYFSLDFLNKDDVELGNEFESILPILWAKSGCVGMRPENIGEADYIFPIYSNFSVLINEYAFSQFKEEMKNHTNIEYVYIVTNSNDAFSEMASEFSGVKSYQLYKDYLDNFMIQRSVK
ncbi:adenine-specific DNA-methyltransferase [Paenibacillus sp. PvP094]|uniref:site-specific DNA-methyltransferase n=1 Tax=Paenibacillus sp. PvP094 TaxID=3156394 RepID=UPI003399160D